MKMQLFSRLPFAHLVGAEQLRQRQPERAESAGLEQLTTRGK